jgi:imidazole glycerol-phosphate synthase subunit HisF
VEIRKLCLGVARAGLARQRLRKSFTNVSNLRLIARLDVKGPHLIKGVHLEGLRKVGDPQAFAQKYYAAGIDEIIYMDAVASLYGRNNLTDIVRHTAEETFIPITVGGGVRSVDSALELLHAGADKFAINTAAVTRPELISELAENFGSQCIVLSIEACANRQGGWEAYTDGGREKTGLDVVEWATRGAQLGAGEILLTSVDREGTRKGFDLNLTKAVSEAVGIPVIASGGMGSVEHLCEAVEQGRADAVAMADIIHFNRMAFEDIRSQALSAGLPVRHFG